MPKELGIPLRELLAHPSLKAAKLVAGEQGLDRLVKYVNVMEVPDILDWVKEGELLLTTVFAIRNDLGAQSLLIKQLASKKLAGLAIKPKRYIDKIPDIMLQQAKEYHLPLIELPQDASFSDIISPIMSEILNNQATILRRADEVHARLSQVVLEGGDLPEIAGSIAELLYNNPIIIENCMSEAVAIAPACLDNADNIIKNLPEFKFLRNIVRGCLKINNQEIGYVRTPIVARKKHYGAITVIEKEHKVSERDELILVRAATIAALEMINHLAINDVERRYYNEFINEVLVAGPSEEKSLWQRGKDLKIDLGQTQLVAIVHIDMPKNDDNDEAAQEDRNMLFLQHLVQGLRDRFPPISVGYKYDKIVLFIPEQIKGSSKNLDYKERIQLIAQYVGEKVTHMFGQTKFFIGVGRPNMGLLGLQGGYQEAVRAYELGQNIWPKSKVFYFDDLGIYRLLGGNNNKRDLQIFVNETVGPIIKYDQQKGTELLKTLEIYFECKSNLKKVSEKMFTHYNTILYRLERITKITNSNLDDAATCLNLQLGIKVKKLLDI